MQEGVLGTMYSEIEMISTVWATGDNRYKGVFLDVQKDFGC